MLGEWKNFWTTPTFKHSYTFTHSYRKPFDTRSRQAFCRRRFSTPWAKKENLRSDAPGAADLSLRPRGRRLFVRFGSYNWKMGHLCWRLHFVQRTVMWGPSNRFVYLRAEVYWRLPTLLPFQSPFNLHICCWRYYSTQHNNALAWTPCDTHVL